MNLQLGTRKLGGSPTVIIAVRDDVHTSDLQEALNTGAHCIELRIDSFAQKETNAIVEEVRRLSLAPTLATIRHSREGGAWDSDETARLALYRAVLPLVDGVDCELSAPDVCAPLFAEARKSSKLSIGSYHDFDACPEDSELDALIPAADDLGADIVKVAAHCATNDHLRRLAAFTLRHAERGVVVIGMGEAGAPSRVFFPALGSLLTFTFLGKPTAPGQLNCKALVAYLTGLYTQ